MLTNSQLKVKMEYIDLSENIKQSISKKRIINILTVNENLT